MPVRIGNKRRTGGEIYMGDVLSQNEIDNLLQALSSGELDAEEIKDSDKKQYKLCI